MLLVATCCTCGTFGWYTTFLLVPTKVRCGLWTRMISSLPHAPICSKVRPSYRSCPAPASPEPLLPSLNQTPASWRRALWLCGFVAVKPRSGKSGKTQTSPPLISKTRTYVLFGTLIDFLEKRKHCQHLTMSGQKS